MKHSEEHKRKISKSMRGINFGELNGMWKGNNASRVAGQIRAQCLFKIENCEICSKPAYDRHHKDLNTLNNDPLNVQFLCRSCHMKIDGRMFKRNSNGKFS